VTLSGDLDRAWEHQERVVATVRDSYRSYLKHLKVESREGHARFLGPEAIEIEGANGRETVEARHAIIATGAAPIVPEPFALKEGRVLSTDMLFDRPPPPGRRVAIIGSGVIATEFAFILRMLGREVTWLTRSPPLARLGFSPQALSTLKRAARGCRASRRGASQGYESVGATGRGAGDTSTADGRTSFEVGLGACWVPAATPITAGPGPRDRIGVRN
jgi:dihydrolipoamide dehydrogenase